MEVKIINKSHHPLPGYATPLSAGMDIRANLTGPVVLKAQNISKEGAHFTGSKD